MYIFMLTHMAEWACFKLNAQMHKRTLSSSVFLSSLKMACHVLAPIAPPSLITSLIRECQC